MSDRYSFQEFMGKMDWEGGAYGALEYGIRLSDYDLPKEAEDKWCEIQEVFGEFSDLITDFYAIAEEYGVEF
jgi:hypothetical protein